MRLTYTSTAGQLDLAVRLSGRPSDHSAHFGGLESRFRGGAIPAILDCQGISSGSGERGWSEFQNRFMRLLTRNRRSPQGLSCFVAGKLCVLNNDLASALPGRWIQGMNRYPLPRMVCMCTGFCELSSSFWRSQATCTSRVRDEPSLLYSQTRRNSSSRGTT